MKAVIIARVSTEEQKEAGNSLPAQMARLDEYCQRKGFEIVKRFSFDESAYKDRRNEFDSILNFIAEQEGKVAVCFDKVDRLSRNVFDKRVAVLYEKALNDEIELHFVSDGQVINSQISAAEKFQFGITLGLAKYYSDAISDNVKRAMEQKLRKGEWPGKAPYGYRNVDLENKKKWVEIENSEANVVKKMYEWYATGAHSMNTVRTKVKELFGINFSKGRIDQILKNPFYCGTMLYDGESYPHKYKTVISRETYNRVQVIKAGHNKKRFKYAGLPYTYRGLIRCSECGCVITPEKKKGKYVYYHCTQYHGKHGAEWLREEDLTAQFSRAFQSLTVPKAVVEDIVETLRASHKDKKRFHDELLAQYQTDYQKYQNRIERMYEDYLDESITKNEYEKRRSKYRSEQDVVKSKIDQLQETDEGYYITVDHLLKLANKAGELFKSSEMEQKRQLLKLTLQNLTLNGRNIECDWVKPFDAIAKHAPRKEWLRRLDSNQQPRP